jgi:hypothetical protein
MKNNLQSYARVLLIPASALFGAATAGVHTSYSEPLTKPSVLLSKWCKSPIEPRDVRCLMYRANKKKLAVCEREGWHSDMCVTLLHGLLPAASQE